MTAASAHSDLEPRLDFLSPLAASPLLERLAGALPAPGACLQLRGVHGALKGILLAKLFERSGRQLVLIAPDAEAAQEVWNDASLLLGEERALYIGDRYSRVQKRIRNIASTFAENADALRSLTDEPLRLVVTDIRTVGQEFPSVRDIREQSVHLALGAGMEQLELIKRLSFGGFEQTEFVSTTGEFSLRGGI
ncbi:MAG: hypothetical protein IH600_09960, partial [Bacteroidetes bacterium]|nr:hypothetical protein [Bacteroidota bacterium]